MESKNFLTRLFGIVLYPAIAIILLCVSWYLLTIPLDGFLPTPLLVVKDFIKDIRNPDTYLDVWLTTRRILIGFVGSVILGTTIGMLMGIRKTSEFFFLPWVVIGLSIPGPVYILMSILILGIKESSTMVALIASVTPYVTTIIFQGVRAIDPKLTEMGRLYKAPPTQYLKDVIFPQVTPYLLAGIRTSFAMSWKLVVIIESMSSSRGIGAQIKHYFQVLEPAQVFAFTFMFTIIMVLIELVFFKQLEKYLLRWRTVVHL